MIVKDNFKDICVQYLGYDSLERFSPNGNIIKPHKYLFKENKKKKKKKSNLKSIIKEIIKNCPCKKQLNNGKIKEENQNKSEVETDKNEDNDSDSGSEEYQNKNEDKKNNNFVFDPGLRFPGVEFERIYKSVWNIDMASLLIQFALTGHFPKKTALPANGALLNGNLGVVLFPVLRGGNIKSIQGLEKYRLNQEIPSRLKIIYH